MPTPRSDEHTKSMKVPGHSLASLLEGRLVSEKGWDSAVMNWKNAQDVAEIPVGLKDVGRWTILIL